MYNALLDSSRHTVSVAAGVTTTTIALGACATPTKTGSGAVAQWWENHPLNHRLVCCFAQTAAWYHRHRMARPMTGQAGELVGKNLAAVLDKEGVVVALVRVVAVVLGARWRTVREMFFRINRTHGANISLIARSA